MDVDGYPSPTVFVDRISGGSMVGSSVSATLSMIIISNISRADAGTFKISYINVFGIADLSLELVIKCEYCKS